MRNASQIFGVAVLVIGAQACSGTPTAPPAPAEPATTYKTLWSLVRVLHVGADHVVVRDFADGFAGFEIHDVTKQIWYLRREQGCPSGLFEYPKHKLGEDVLLVYRAPRLKHHRCDPPPASVPERGWVRLDECEQVKIIDVFTGENLQVYTKLPEIPLDRQFDGVQVTADTEGINATLGEDTQVFSNAFVCGGNLYGSQVTGESTSIFAVKSVAGKLALEPVVMVPASMADGALITHEGRVGFAATDAIYFGDEKLVVDPPLGPIIRTSSQGLVFTDAPRTSGPQPLTVGTNLLPGVKLCEKLEPKYCDNQ